MSHGRPPRRPRWQPTADTIGIARHYAAKPNTEDVELLIKLLKGSFDALRTGFVTELQYSILRGALSTAAMIERQRVVKGVAPFITAAAVAIDSIWNRITWTATGGHVTLYHHELTVMREFVTMHAFQIRQLSRAEYLRAVNSAKGIVGQTAQVLYGLQAKEATA
jgi:hypothetical protein